MSAFFQLFSPTDLAAVLNARPGETKLGQQILLPDPQQSIEQNIQDSQARFVLLGIPEDIGVRANGGVGGTQSVWSPFLSAMLNIQAGAFMDGNDLLLLGQFDFSEWMRLSEQESLPALRNRVAQIDEEVYPLIQMIAQCGKIPIVIGGGHNNAFPILKGVSLAKSGPINCINLDAHADFRIEEGRHSGNGFRYAFQQNFLHRYAVIGLHENYNGAAILQDMAASDRIFFSFFEDIFIRQDLDFKQVVYEAINFTDSDPTGIELDLDCIERVLSSAATPSGMSTLDARRFITWTAEKTEVAYVHFTEGATLLNNGRQDSSTAKLLAYLVSDFIKAYQD